MPKLETRDLLRATAERAADFLDSLPQRPAGAAADAPQLRARLAMPLPDDGVGAEAALAALSHGVEPGLVASAGPRYFGFVIGGSTPASLAADWLTSAWDQNAQTYATSPAAAVVEEVVAGWLLDLLRLPADASVGFVTGGQMANFTALAAARNALLERAGWDVAARGLAGAPPLRVLASQEAHATVRNALYLLGIGTEQLTALPADSQGRLQLDALDEALARTAGPVLVSAQAGNVNSGAFEPLAAIAGRLQGRNAWLHVDGAFGLWAAASPRLRPLLDGAERADSWATDAHKWLNVPYDSGIVAVRRRADHHSFKLARCAYAGAESAALRDGSSWAPENSRRARAFVLYAALLSLGRSGVQSLVERSVHLAQLLARHASALPGARILNEVVLNQVLIRFDPPPQRTPEDWHAALASHVQQEGVCWLGATRWRGEPALRVSISNWSTGEADIEAVVAALARARERAVGAA